LAATLLCWLSWSYNAAPHVTVPPLYPARGPERQVRGASYRARGKRGGTPSAGAGAKAIMGPTTQALQTLKDALD